MRADQDQDQNAVNQRKGSPQPVKPTRAEYCRRCQKVLDTPERETYFARTGMCFWCAYVDSQG